MLLACPYGTMRVLVVICKKLVVDNGNWIHWSSALVKKKSVMNGLVTQA